MKLADWKRQLQAAEEVLPIGLRPAPKGLVSVADESFGPVFQAKLVGAAEHVDITLGTVIDAHHRKTTPHELVDLFKAMGFERYDFQINAQRNQFEDTLELGMCISEGGMPQTLQLLRFNFGGREIPAHRWGVQVVVRRPVGSQCTKLVGDPVDEEMLRLKMPAAVFHDAIQFRAWPESSWISDVKLLKNGVSGHLRTDQHSSAFLCEQRSAGLNWRIVVPPYPGASLSVKMVDLEGAS